MALTGNIQNYGTGTGSQNYQNDEPTTIVNIFMQAPGDINGGESETNAEIGDGSSALTQDSGEASNEQTNTNSLLAMLLLMLAALLGKNSQDSSGGSGGQSDLPFPSGGGGGGGGGGGMGGGGVGGGLAPGGSGGNQTGLPVVDNATASGSSLSLTDPPPVYTPSDSPPTYTPADPPPLYAGGSTAASTASTAPSTTPGPGANAPGTFSNPGVSGKDNNPFSQSAPPAGQPLSAEQGKAQAVSVANQLMVDFPGMTKEQAAGIAGNLYHESAGMNSNVNEFGSDPSSETYGQPNNTQFGYGYAQWTGSRKTDFLNYSKEQGLDPQSPAANYAFLRHELMYGEADGTPSSLPAIQSAQSVDDAAGAFRKTYERATNPVDEKRLAAANDIYSMMA